MEHRNQFNLFLKNRNLLILTWYSNYKTVSKNHKYIIRLDLRVFFLTLVFRRDFVISLCNFCILRVPFSVWFDTAWEFDFMRIHHSILFQSIVSFNCFGKNLQLVFQISLQTNFITLNRNLVQKSSFHFVILFLIKIHMNDLEFRITFGL